MTPIQEATLEETCPECQAPPGYWCVYILWTTPHPHYQPPRENVARVGKRTKRLHNGRFNAAWVTERKVKRAKEVAMLREFFARFGGIFDADAN